jgi:hypothetical protein
MQKVREICALMKGSEDPATFGNAREIRNLFEDTMAQQAARLVAQAGKGKAADAREIAAPRAGDIYWDNLGDESLRDTLSGESLRTVAVHEMGHALVGHLVDGPRPVSSRRFPPRMRSAARSLQRSMSPVFTRAQLLGRAARALAGRAAEEVVFGVLTSGACTTWKVAERIALELLRTGMSEKTTHAALAEYAATTEDRFAVRGAASARARRSASCCRRPMRSRSRSCATRSARCALRPSASSSGRTLTRDELGILLGPRTVAGGPAPT